MEAIDELTDAKELELRELKRQREKRISEIINSLQTELLEEQKRVSQLKGDFDYNLSLLASRDEELAQYEASFTHIKRIVNGLVAENSELKVHLDKACKEVEKEKDANLQLQAHHQARLKEIHSRMDSYRHVKQKELDEEREKLECLQRELRNKLLALEEEGHTQREAMMADFDEALRKRDHEHQLRLDQLSSSLQQHQSTQLHLEKELAHAQSAIARLEEELQLKCRECKDLVKDRKEEVWHMEGEVQQLQSAVHEWTVKYRRAQEDLDKMKQTFQRKHAELDRSVREKQALLDAAKQAHMDRESVLEGELLKLRERVEHKEAEWSYEESVLKNTVLDKEQQLESLQAKMAAEGGCMNGRVRELEQQLAEQSRQLQCVLKERHECQTTLSKKDLDMCRLQRELSSAEERLRVSEKRVSEQVLECEERVGQVEKMAQVRHKQHISELTDRNNKLSSELEEARKRADELATSCARLGGENKAARELLSQHNIPWLVSTSASHTSEITRLQMRNKELLNIIAQMRAELEQLSELTDRREQEHEEEKKRKEEVAPSVQYVTYLEKDVYRLKAEIRQMSEKLAQASKPPTPPRGSTRGGAAAGLGGKGGAAEVSNGKQQHVDQLAVLTDTIAHLQKQNAELEKSREEWKEKSSSLQDRLKEEKEMLYLMKASKTPQSRLHQKLLQATQVIISLVREKELLSKHIQQLVDGATPSSSSGPLPSLNVQHPLEPVGGPSEDAQQLELRPQQQQAAVVQSVDRVVQTSPVWQLGKVQKVEGRQPVEVQIRRSVNAKDKMGGHGDVRVSSRSHDLGRTVKAGSSQEASNVPWATVPVEFSGKESSRQPVSSRVGGTGRGRTVGVAPRSMLPLSPLELSPTYQTDLLDQSLPSLRFSESSLEGGAAALDKMLEQVDEALASDRENWSTTEELKAPPPVRAPQRTAANKPSLEMVGKEVRSHARPLAKHVASSSSQLGKKHIFSRQTVNAAKPQTRRPRNYNIRD